MKAALSAQINKSDRNDARGIAQMMRVGLYRPVHVKTLASQKRRMLLTSRQLLQAKALDIESDLRGTLRNFGEPLLIARRVLREQLGVLHRQLLARHEARDRCCGATLGGGKCAPAPTLNYAHAGSLSLSGGGSSFAQAALTSARPRRRSARLGR